MVNQGKKNAIPFFIRSFFGTRTFHHLNALLRSQTYVIKLDFCF